MTKSEIFKAAHAIARNTVKQVGDYVVAFSFALKTVIAASKKGYSMNNVAFGCIKKFAGAVSVRLEESKTLFESFTKEDAERYIKQNSANAGKIWEANGKFNFYVYN